MFNRTEERSKLRNLQKKYKHFVITGVDVRNSRFKIKTRSALHALSINLYRGSVWGVLEDGKRKLLKRVYN